MLTHDQLDDLVPIEPAAMVDRQVIGAAVFHERRCTRPPHADVHEDSVDLLAEQKGVKVDRATILARTRAPMP